jgi:hypothetical protein
MIDDRTEFEQFWASKDGYEEPVTPTPAELARGFAAAFDTATMHQFDSWKDVDLYRAIKTEPEGPGQAEAIAEYVAELKARGVAREAQTALEADLNGKYGI